MSADDFDFTHPPRDEAQEELDESWGEFLDMFELVYEASFRPRGYARDESLVAFVNNRLFNKISEFMERGQDDDKPW